MLVPHPYRARLMTQPRYYSAEEVRRALPMGEAIEAMRVAFGELSAGRVDMPQRSVVPCGGGAVTLVMPGRCDLRYGLGAKIVSVFPDNPARGKSAVQAVVILLDDQEGTPCALIDGESLTAIRTGAASGLATDMLARPDATSVTVVGAGPQARTQLEAVCRVRSIRQVQVCARTEASATRMIRELESANWLRSASVTRPDSIPDAVASADIVCTATNSAEPVFPADVVRPGTHVNAVGSFTRRMREIDPLLLRSAYLVVDHIPAALAEAGEVVAAIERQWVDKHDLVELGDIINGASAGRTSPEQVTMFKSVGVCVQDLVAGARIVERGMSGAGL